jgi:hypothetical protein
MKHVPWQTRHSLGAYDRALDLIAARHEQHKAAIAANSDRLERVAEILGKVGAV